MRDRPDGETNGFQSHLLLKRFPTGMPTPNDFLLEDRQVEAPRPGELSVRALCGCRSTQGQDSVLDVEAIADGEFNAAAPSFFGQHGIVPGI